MNLRGRNKVSPEFSMSSMTDIVFLLLVFFLLTSPAITPDALDLILPKAKGKSSNKPNVSVSITKDLDYYVDKERVPRSNVKSAVIEALSNAEERVIFLRAEGDVALKNAVDIMALGNEIKAKVILAVDPNQK
ncbi:biopolymer transporter ExbD [uncultured Dokdonia sp.]|uniref:ExbD/TolR family protein n=1 Tax=uncultured Dokdonia sp. TaxID=575653 RepID=UPI00262DAB43|nr:biopolymer transporter ExbD [uncultured Dokdonia sp.]